MFDSLKCFLGKHPKDMVIVYETDHAIAKWRCVECNRMGKTKVR